MHVYIKIEDVTLLSKNGSKNCEKKVPKKRQVQEIIKINKKSTKQAKKK